MCKRDVYKRQQLKDIDQKLQLLLEQVAVLNNKRFGKSSEKLGGDNQICFMEVDGNIVLDVYKRQIGK